MSLQKKQVNSFQEYLTTVTKLIEDGSTIILYRGQDGDHSLLPSIARKDPTINTTEIEIEMINELKRRSSLLVTRPFTTDWEWLVYAQHFELKTRLLDWTSNPLSALWFACSNEGKIGSDSFVYILIADKDFIVDIKKEESPFTNTRTRILRPSLNNERIIAQSGWFTAHKYSDKYRKFIKLESLAELSIPITRVKIPAGIKKEILSNLSTFGINSRTIYPDITGLCKHLNWKYLIRRDR